MMFPQRIRGIRSGDRVLDIGPGGLPHPRANVLLEKTYDDPELAKAQRGHAPLPDSRQSVVYFDGVHFPFADREFDYAICSHVLEHIPDIGNFVKEITRVAKRGYIEFPTAYYDYLYNFDVHITLLLYENQELRWLPKRDTMLAQVEPFASFFRQSLEAKHYSLVRGLKDHLFQGFEWTEQVSVRRVREVAEVLYTNPVIPPPRGLLRRLADRVLRR